MPDTFKIKKDITSGLKLPMTHLGLCYTFRASSIRFVNTGAINRFYLFYMSLV
jgi:hypothetical protein